MVSYYFFLFTSKIETWTRGTKSMQFLVFRRDHLLSTSKIFCGSGSFAVQFGDHFQSGIISGRESFAALYITCNWTPRIGAWGTNYNWEFWYRYDYGKIISMHENNAWNEPRQTHEFGLQVLYAWCAYLAQQERGSPSCWMKLLTNQTFSILDMKWIQKPWESGCGLCLRPGYDSLHYNICLCSQHYFLICFPALF